MTTLLIDCTTGELLEKDLTNQELAQFKKDETEFQAKIEIEAAKASAKTAILDRLGLTADELKTILG
jgi:hypothetical protein